jgi:hypothetical protein
MRVLPILVWLWLSAAAVLGQTTISNVLVLGKRVPGPGHALLPGGGVGYWSNKYDHLDWISWNTTTTNGDLRAWWKLDQNLQDSVGGHHMSLGGFGDTNYFTGLHGQSIRGTTAASNPRRLVVAAGEAGLGDTPFTLQVWFKPGSTNGYPTIYRHAGTWGAVSNIWNADLAAGGVILRSYSATNSGSPVMYMNHPRAPVGNSWNCLLVRWDGAVWRVTLNNQTWEQVGQALPHAGVPGELVLTLGVFTGFPPMEWDEIALWGRSLSEMEAAYLWNDGEGRTVP